MANENATLDQNFKNALLATSNDANKETRRVLVNPVTDRVLVETTGTVEVLEGLEIGAYDYVSVAYPIDTTEVYTFKSGGSGGASVAVVTIVYTDNTKVNLSTVTKTPTV